MSSATVFLDGLNHRDRVSRSIATLKIACSISARPIVSTKFSPYTAVLLHMVTEAIPHVRVVWIDTGYNTRATRAFAEETAEQLGIELQVFMPENHIITVPPALDDPLHSAFVDEVKLQPFRRALANLSADAWITSVRRDQTAHRRSLRTFDEGMPGVVKVSPLLDWSEADMQRYADTHALSIGPECYDPTKGEPMRECGLHTRLSA